jgi:hypothetical protein
MQQSRHAADTVRAGLDVRTIIRYLLLAAIAAVLLLSSLLQTGIHPAEAQISNGNAIKINFQPATAPTYTGYLVDSGASYGIRNGHTYGWSVDNSANTRYRNASNSPDVRYDTLNHMQKISNTMLWEIALPNGKYSVRIVAGDPSNIDSTYRINAENIRVISGIPSTSNRWIDGSAEVIVSDGKLTISNGDGAVNNKINFIVITAIAVTPSPTNTASNTPTVTRTPTITNTRTPTDTPVITVETKDYTALTQTSAAETARFIPPSTSTVVVATTTRTSTIPRPTNTNTPTYTPTTPTTCGTSNKALHRPATASSSENANTLPGLAVDGNTGSRWSSAFSDPQWIRVDLGSIQSICRVQLRWEAAYGRAYEVQTSNDGTSWTSIIYSTTAGDGGVDNLTGLNGSGRYVRIYGTQRGTTYGYSLWELEVY